MPPDLNAALAWKKAAPDELKMLQNLQGNILKGHGREHTVNLFFQLAPGAVAKSKRVLRELAHFHITSAHQQLLAAERHKADPTQSGGAFVHLALSHLGYEELQMLTAAPGDIDFQKGMKHPDSLQALNDKLANWEPGFNQDLHGVLLVAHDTEAQAQARAHLLQDLLEKAGARIVHVQVGKALKNAAGIGIEHFGYVDGRSQPLMLEEDLKAENLAGGSSQWDPRFPLKTALMADPGVTEPQPLSFGSLFIFRKLEQNVRAFKSREQALADALGLTGEDRELAGALVVGRFEDGTPVTLSDDARGVAPPNDFNYANDPGSRCPFHAHIRKSNPRRNANPLDPDRTRVMARRGIPFEDRPRTVHPNDLPETRSLAEFNSKVAPLLPEGGVGLLFMAYNVKIEDQFRFVQQSWVNNPGFSVPGTGLDPLIGQGVANPADQHYAASWDDPGPQASANTPFSGFVTMRGGEYFFSPSLSFLRSL